MHISAQHNPMTTSWQIFQEIMLMDNIAQDVTVKHSILCSPSLSKNAVSM
jgi:hypothetical protein